MQLLVLHYQTLRTFFFLAYLLPFSAVEGCLYPWRHHLLQFSYNCAMFLFQTDTAQNITRHRSTGQSRKLLGHSTEYYGIH